MSRDEIRRIWRSVSEQSVITEEGLVICEAIAAELERQNAELVRLLKLARAELHACQAVIHLAGGFDPAYVKDAQAAIKQMDAALAATQPEQGDK